MVKDDFNNLNNWVSEVAPLENSSVYIANKNLVLNTKGGVTVWLKKKLSGNIKIEFDRTVLLDTGTNDRLSDLNVFWMATDPRNQNLFTRNGVFEQYDSLSLYYVGMGGNSNTTTRFRKYEGNGSRTLLQEYNTPEYLLKANKTYHITIALSGNTTTFSVDGKTYFTYTDPHLLREGYFGFRSTKSRQAIASFRVYKIR